MSEERATYNGEAPQEKTYQIRDEATPRTHYSQIPNIVDDMDLSPHAYRLYGHLRRVAGETGLCWQSTKTLATACGMSAGKVSEAKHELEHVYPPLIRITSQRKADGAIYHEIAVTDVWQINNDFYNKMPVQMVKGSVARSQYEQARSQCETKNNPLIQEEPKKDNENKKANPFKFYTDNINPLTAYTRDELKGMCEEYTDEWVIDAMKEAIKSGSKTLRYVNTVLANWKAHHKGWKPGDDKKPVKNNYPAQAEPSRRVGPPLRSLD